MLYWVLTIDYSVSLLEPIIVYKLLLIENFIVSCPPIKQILINKLILHYGVLQQLEISHLNLQKSALDVFQFLEPLPYLQQ